MPHRSAFKGLFRFLILAALLNIVWLVLNSSIELPQSVGARQFRIALALVVGAIALWPGRIVGLLITIVALLWITLEYILWWKRSVDVLDAAGMSFANSPHSLYLLRGTWWDLGMLLATVIGLLWAANHLRHAYQSRHATFEGEAK